MSDFFMLLMLNNFRFSAQPRQVAATFLKNVLKDTTSVFYKDIKITLGC